MTRRIETRTETIVDVEYDYEENPYDVEYDVEILSVFDGETLLWEGTAGDAHCSGGASSNLLPEGVMSERTRLALRDDALWSLVAPTAEAVDGEPDIHVQRMLTSVHEIGNTQSVEAVPQLVDRRLIVTGASSLPLTDPEWMLVTGEHCRLLAQRCYLTDTKGDEASFVIGGIHVAERTEHDPR